MPDGQDDFVKPDDLHLDLSNPRMPDSHFKNEKDTIEYLAGAADVSELVQSICTSGWFDYEPLIVLRDSNVVIEGNRRLAALRIIKDPALQALTGVTPPSDSKSVLPAKIRVRYVETKAEARSFIGFKHINGAFRWDSLAKARYAAEWLHDGAEVAEVSQQLGDNHNTILRLVNGWRVLDQAEQNKLFDREKRDKRLFAFSHLYTGLTRPGMRDYLGLDSSTGLLPEQPVQEDHFPNLKRVTSWLYGQPDEPAVIRSQNPDLKKLVTVMANPRALQTLERTRKLDNAFDLAEDKTARFAEVVYSVIDQLEEALVLSRNYEGDSDVRATVENIAKTARSINMIVRTWETDHAESTADDDDDA